MIDLDIFQARLTDAAAVVESAYHAIEGEWGDAIDVYMAARFLGADVYAPDFDGTDVPALVAEVRAAREVMATAHAHLVGCVDRQLEAALDAYDKVTGEASR
jgi:hypothetical protein